MLLLLVVVEVGRVVDVLLPKIIGGCIYFRVKGHCQSRARKIVENVLFLEKQNFLALLGYNTVFMIMKNNFKWEYNNLRNNNK